ncbi:MAG: cache domain-containing protein [Chitinispirillaceae bacterium]|nr:cache domain-containing protein [Chitinispirillaceae bacterium]
MAKFLFNFSRLIGVMMLYSFTLADNGKVDLEQEINNYFAKLEDSFSKVVSSSVLKDRNLGPAERLFVRAMKKNRVYNTFIRTNSKGVIISEVIRGKKPERPMRDISNQQWFNYVKNKKEPFYNLIKDSDEGRYYIFWARPILKDRNRVVGSVAVKIDIWDGFYEISKDIYSPFIIKLGNKTLFSHKVNKEENYSTKEEKELAINGIKNITLVILSAGAPVASTVVEEKKDTGNLTALTKDTTKTDGEKSQKKGGGTIIVVLILIILFGGIGIGSYMLISWMQRRAFLKRLDEEDNNL